MLGAFTSLLIVALVIAVWLLSGCTYNISGNTAPVTINDNPTVNTNAQAQIPLAP